ncbi:MAG: response regulator [Pseudomonadota bacterium]
MAKANDTLLVLLVDDDHSDSELIRRALECSTRDIELVSVGSGPEALDYLRREGHWTDVTTLRIPDLLILDLEMPGMRGREVLARIRADPLIPYIPIVVLTASDDPEDIEGCYESGANSYLVKPFGVKPFSEAMELIERFWLGSEHLRRPVTEA